MNLSHTTDLRGGWLIVEDESLVALLIEDAIVDMGLTPVGPVTRVANALEMIRQHRPDGAVLDVNLAGEAVYPVASELASRGVPFVFVTGYGETGVRKDFSDRPVVQKPFAVEDIQAAVRQLLALPSG